MALIAHGGESGGQGGPGVLPGVSVYHYLHDVLGSVVALTDASANVVERYTYDPYGKVLIEDSSANALPQSAYGNAFLWTGQRYDSAVGLYGFLFRAYSPDLGRWLQRDPMGYVNGMNLHQYCIGNPLSWLDPWGLTIYSIVRGMELIALISPGRNMTVSRIGFAAIDGYGLTDRRKGEIYINEKYNSGGDTTIIPLVPKDSSKLGEYLQQHMDVLDLATIMIHEFYHLNEESWFSYYTPGHGAGPWWAELAFLYRLRDRIDCAKYPRVCFQIDQKIREAKEGLDRDQPGWRREITTPEPPLATPPEPEPPPVSPPDEPPAPPSPPTTGPGKEPPRPTDCPPTTNET